MYAFARCTLKNGKTHNVCKDGKTPAPPHDEGSGPSKTLLLRFLHKWVAYVSIIIAHHKVSLSSCKSEMATTYMLASCGNAFAEPQLLGRFPEIRLPPKFLCVAKHPSRADENTCCSIGNSTTRQGKGVQV